MNWKFFLNPLEKYSERQLFIFGIVTTIVGSWITSVFNVVLDGAFDMHFSSHVSFVQSILFNLFSVLILFFFLLSAAYLINKKTRAIDILNAVLIFRIPYYLASFLFGIPAIKRFNENISEQLNDIGNLQLDASVLFFATIFGIIILIFMAWALTLLVLGFRTATNAKKAKHYVLLFVTFILAEIVSKVLLYLI